MRTIVQFRNFEGMKHHRNFIEENIEKSLTPFESWQSFDSHIILDAIKSKSEGHNPVFECELVLIELGMNRPIVIKKKNKDFYCAVRNSLRAAEKVLRRRSKERVSIRRKFSFKKKIHELLAT